MSFWLILFVYLVHGKVTSSLRLNDDLDYSALTSHILQLEQTVSDLKAHNQIQERKQAAILSSILSKLTSTSEELLRTETSFSDLQKEHNNTLRSLADLEERFLSVETELANLKVHHISTLNESEVIKHGDNVFADMKNEIFHLTEVQNETLAELSEVKVQLTRNSGELISTKMNLNSTSEGLSTVKRNVELNSWKVYFKAWVSSDTKVYPNGTVIFDHVDSNYGQGYNSTSGVFQAPFSGTYIFTVSLQTIAGESAVFYITDCRTSGASFRVQSAYEYASVSSVFHVDRGHTVSVLKWMGTEVTLHRGPVTQFSGSLLHSDY